MKKKNYQKKKKKQYKLNSGSFAQDEFLILKFPWIFNTDSSFV